MLLRLMGSSTDMPHFVIRAMAYTAISRNSAHSVPSSAGAFPSPARGSSAGSLARLSPLPKPKRPPAVPAPLLQAYPLQELSTSSAEGPVPPPSSFGRTEDCDTFHVSGPRREAPPPALLPQVLLSPAPPVSRWFTAVGDIGKAPAHSLGLCWANGVCVLQHHIRSSSGGSRQEILSASSREGSFDMRVPGREASENMGLLRNQVRLPCDRHPAFRSSLQMIES